MSSSTILAAVADVLFVICGRSLNPFGQIRSNSEVRSSSAFGVLKLTLHPDAYDWEFVPVAGKTFTDSGSTRCH
jgi:hypothetical protein